MHRKMERFTIMALLLGSSSLSGVEQAKGMPLASTRFGVYASLFSSAPLSRGEFETLKPGLQKDAFSTMDSIYWRMSDASGTLLITALPETGRFSVKFTPPAPIRLGDSVLAALIGKSVNLEVGDDSDLITITIGTRSLSNGNRTGTRTEYLKFNLQGGMWEETGIFLHWNTDPLK